MNSYLKSCFLIFPNYNLGHGLMEMAYNEYINEYYAKIGEFPVGPQTWLGFKNRTTEQGDTHTPLPFQFGGGEGQLMPPK